MDTENKQPPQPGSDLPNASSSSEEFAQFLFENIADPSVETVFSNRVVAILQDSDILLYFGLDRPRGGAKEPDRNSIQYSTCIAMSHAYFLRTMDYLMPRYNLLRELYNAPISAIEVELTDPDRYQRAMNMLQSKSEIDEENG